MEKGTEVQGSQAQQMPSLREAKSILAEVRNLQDLF
jgi:hypothetical protein